LADKFILVKCEINYLYNNMRVDKIMCTYLHYSAAYDKRIC